MQIRCQYAIALSEAAYPTNQTGQNESISYIYVATPPPPELGVDNACRLIWKLGSKNGHIYKMSFEKIS
jgi:hypothetical protein